MKCKEQDAHKFECCQVSRHCYGSKCMAWKFIYVKKASHIPGSYATDSNGNAILEKTDIGYCGLVYK